MPVTPASLKDIRVNAFSVIADVYAEPLGVVTYLSFDLACLRMTKCIPQQFSGDPRNLILEQRLQRLPRTFHLQPEADARADVWTTYNVVQENLMRGGLSGRSTTGRNTRTRTIEAIREDVRINNCLWQLAMNLISA